MKAEQLNRFVLPSQTRRGNTRLDEDAHAERYFSNIPSGGAWPEPRNFARSGDHLPSNQGSRIDHDIGSGH